MQSWNFNDSDSPGLSLSLSHTKRLCIVHTTPSRINISFRVTAWLSLLATFVVCFSRRKREGYIHTLPGPRRESVALPLRAFSFIIIFLARASACIRLRRSWFFYRNAVNLNFAERSPKLLYSPLCGWEWARVLSFWWTNFEREL